MPSLTAAEHVAPGDSWELEDKMSCSEHSKFDGVSRTECVVDDEESVAGADQSDYGTSVGDKADSGECLKESSVLAAPDHHTTPNLPDEDGDSPMDGNCKAIETAKETLNLVCGDKECSTETKDVLSPSRDPEESKDGGLEVDEHDALDGGWAYMVLLGTFTIMTVIAVLGPGFGILFSNFLMEMKTSATTTAAIFNSQSFAWSVSNMLAGPLTEQFGWQRVATAGGLLSSVGMVASAYAPSAPFLFFSYSILTGFGSGSSCLVTFAVIPHYFKRLLGRANGLTTAGMCVGGMIGPPLVTYLQEQFGFKGATLIVAAFALHICLAAALFRPVQRSTKVKKIATTSPGSCQLMGQMVRSLARNCLLLKSPRVLVIAFGSCFVMGIYLNLFLMMPFVMKEKGHTQETAAWCMSISNLCNLAARLIVSSCADMAWFSVLGCYIALATLMCCSTIAFSLVQDVTWIIVVLSLWGVSIGACMCLYPIIMMRYMGLHLYMGVLGVSGFIHGIWMLCCGPAIGVVRDLSGSYAISVSVLGASGFLAVILFLLMPAAVAYDKRKEQHEKTKDAEIGG